MKKAHTEVVISDTVIRNNTNGRNDEIRTEELSKSQRGPGEEGEGVTLFHTPSTSQFFL